MDEKNNNRLAWIFSIISWIIAAYFFLIFHLIAGFPPIREITDTGWVFIALSIFCFLLPFAKRIKLGKLFEFEREIRAIRQDIGDFKTETRQTLTVLTSTMSTISNLSSTVNVTLPTIAELKAAQEDVGKISIKKTSTEARTIKQELVLEDEDTIMSLARTRIQIEQLLRKTLGKRLVSPGVGVGDLRFLSVHSLLKHFAKEYTSLKYKSLQRPLEYVLKVCNAAIHGQRISPGEAAEALDMGAKIIAVLADVTSG